jgi:hypothetical protein
LYGSRVAVTEMTVTGRSSGVAEGVEAWRVDAGLDLHPASDAPTIKEQARSSHGRITVRI